MATTLLATQQIVSTGLDATYSAAVSGDGHVFDNAGRDVVLHVKNGSGGGLTVTIVTPNVVDGDLAIGDRTVSVPAGEDRFIGPFKSVYEAYDSDNDVDQGIQVTYSATTTITVAALKV